MAKPRKSGRARKKKSDAWFPFYIGDYLADTMDLTARQHGAYCLLLMAAYRRRGALTLDETTLRQITRLTAEEWAVDWPVVRQFFHAEDGAFRQNRVDRELAKTDQLSAARSAAGSAGAEGRWPEGGATGDTAQIGHNGGPALDGKTDANGMANGVGKAWQSDGKSAPPQSQPHSPSQDQDHQASGLDVARGAISGQSDGGGLVGWIFELFNNPNLLRTDEVRVWREMGASDELVREVLSSVTEHQCMANAAWKPSSLKYFTPAISRAIETRKSEELALDRQINEAWRTWEPRVRGYKDHRSWLPEWEGKPDDDAGANPEIPRELLVKYGFGRKDAA